MGALDTFPPISRTLDLIPYQFEEPPHRISVIFIVFNHNYSPATSTLNRNTICRRGMLGDKWEGHNEARAAMALHFQP